MRRLPERVTARRTDLGHPPGHSLTGTYGSHPGPSLTIKEVNNEMVVNVQDPPSPLSL